MRALFLVVAALAAASALALPPVLSPEIPSAASGRYETPAGQCDVVFARYGADHVNVDIACPGRLTVEPDNRVSCAGTCSHSTAFAFRGACPGADGVAYIFPVSGSAPSADWLAFDALDGTDLIVRRSASRLQLLIGGGVSETWREVSDIASPAPYTCSAARKPAPTVWNEINRRMRDIVCRANPGASTCGR